MNDAWNFHFLWIDAVIQVACIVSWTSIFTCQMIVVTDVFIWMVWRRWSSWWRCCICSIVVGLTVSYGFYWLGVVYIWLLQLRPGPKTFQRLHPLYSLEVVQSVVHHYISHRCSFHMVCVAGIGYWRILMTMAHTSLVYVERFRNPRRWQKVNSVGILFL